MAKHSQMTLTLPKGRRFSKIKQKYLPCIDIMQREVLKVETLKKV
jgi:hypothetical protein